MEKNKLHQHLSELLKFYNSRIKEITTDDRQFMYNVKAEFYVKDIKIILENFDKHYAYIGKEVYKIINNFSYSETPLDDFLNKTEKESVIFTEEMYYEFQKSYLEFLIRYYTELLLSNSITMNSTSKLSNLIFEWKLEFNQEFLRLLKGIYGN